MNAKDALLMGLENYHRGRSEALAQVLKHGACIALAGGSLGQFLQMVKENEEAPRAITEACIEEIRREP